MFGFGKQESRKFIDLLLPSTNNKWTNIDANKPVHVGDFGSIEKSTGEFVVEGNLYTHPETREAMKSYEANDTAPTRYEKYTSKGVKELGLSPSLTASVEPIFDVGFDGKWAFKRERGALLVLVTPKMKVMNGFPTSLLLREDLRPLLRGRSICTSVVSCPAFVLYLGNTEEHTFELSLKASVPIPTAPGVQAGGGLGANWSFGSTQGIVKQGLDESGAYVYYPLFSLKQISWGRVASVIRGDEPEADENDVLEDVVTPWDNLDEEGEEVGMLEDSGEPLEDFKPS